MIRGVCLLASARYSGKILASYGLFLEMKKILDFVASREQRYRMRARRNNIFWTSDAVVERVGKQIIIARVDTLNDPISAFALAGTRNNQVNNSIL